MPGHRRRRHAAEFALDRFPAFIWERRDGQFLVGRLPGQPRVIVAGGDSGHGFKHCPGIGELLAQIVAGRELYTAADFLDPARFT